MSIAPKVRSMPSEIHQSYMPPHISSRPEMEQHNMMPNVMQSTTGRPLKFKKPRMGRISDKAGQQRMDMHMMSVMQRTQNLLRPKRPNWMEMPERYQKLDMRFIHASMGKYARPPCDDDEMGWAGDLVMRTPGIDMMKCNHICGLMYNEGFGEECISEPNAPGIWEIGVDGCWYMVTPAEAKLFEEIERRRGTNTKPVVIGGSLM